MKVFPRSIKETEGNCPDKKLERIEEV